jgi:hypothetical protein
MAPALAPGPVAEVPARSAAEERLRRGRVSVRGEQLVNSEKVMRSSLSALSSAQEALNPLGVPREAIPKLPAGTPDVQADPKVGSELLTKKLS